jgi:hypothetical protein
MGVKKDASHPFWKSTATSEDPPLPPDSKADSPPPVPIIIEKIASNAPRSVSRALAPGQLPPDSRAEDDLEAEEDSDWESDPSADEDTDKLQVDANTDEAIFYTS